MKKKQRISRTGETLFKRKSGSTCMPVPFVSGPNPNLSQFIKDYSTPYNPEDDDYDVPAFTKDILVDKAADPKAIYDAHKYWSKKHWAAIREFIRHYLPKQYYPDNQGLVIDPFSGSGMTGVAALMEQKPSILIDLSTPAAFISHHYVHPIDPDIIQEAYDKIMDEQYRPELKAKIKKITGRAINNLGEELDWLYETKCDRCGGKASTEYVVYSETFMCPNCGSIVAIYDCPKVPIGDDDGSKLKPVCPSCFKRNKERGRPEYVISTRSKKYGATQARVSYICKYGCKPKRAYKGKEHKADNCLEEYKKEYKRYFSNYSLCPHNIPRAIFTKGFVYYRDGLHVKNVTKIIDIYTVRNAWALSAIADAIDELGIEKTYLKFPLSAGSLILSLMCSAAHTQIQAGTYYLPPLSKEINALSTYTNKIKKFKDALTILSSFLSPSIVTNESAIHSKIPENSIDYIFTDPPYSAPGAQYAELNDVWRAWLRLPDDNLAEEVIVNPIRRRTLDDWEYLLRRILHKYYLALKPGHWLSICYHDISDRAWRRFQDALLDAGFEIHTVTLLEPLQKSSNQLTAEKVVKSDLVLNCRKPKESDAAISVIRKEPSKTIHDRVGTILEETLSEHPGLTRDKLFDIVARRLLERAQFVEHRFENILAEVAVRAEGDRWYLKSELEQLSQDDLMNEEKAGLALIRFARLRCSGLPAKYAAVIAMEHPKFCEPNIHDRLNEEAIERWVNDNLFTEDKNLLAKKKQKKLELGGRLSGIEFYDALFFYMTKYMKNRKAGQLPKRNLAEFLEEYLVRFKDGDKWHYKAPSGSEAEEMQKARRSGLGRRIKAYANALRENERKYTDDHKPDIRTFVEWLRYCAIYSRYEDGAILYDKAGFKVQQLKSVMIDEEEEETAYDIVKRFAEVCKRRIAISEDKEEVEVEDTEGEE